MDNEILFRINRVTEFGFDFAGDTSKMVIPYCDSHRPFALLCRLMCTFIKCMFQIDSQIFVTRRVQCAF